jgi:hypothetical protein
VAKPERNLLGYCGLYCGDCFAHQGVIAGLARELLKELRAAGFADMAAALSPVPEFSVFRDYPQCHDVLGGLVRFRCKRACRGGGGNPRCLMRGCCLGRGLVGCWECAEFEECDKLHVLERGHGDAAIRNLRIIKRQGVDSFIAGKRYWHVKAAA